MTLDFGDCVIDLERRELWRAKCAVHVEPQVFDHLVHLVQNRDRVVSKDDLIASVWGGRIMSESTLTSPINAARNAASDSGRKQLLIRTIPRKGLRLFGAAHMKQVAEELGVGYVVEGSVRKSGERALLRHPDIRRRNPGKPKKSPMAVSATGRVSFGRRGIFPPSF